MSRTLQLQKFVQAAGWEGATITPLAGDASNRRYDRLENPDGSRAVLMDAPPEKGEDVRPFVKIAKFLKACGLSAPEIFHADPMAGFLLIEDLGDGLFAREMARDPGLERPLYEAATDVLVELHKHAPPPLLAYDSAVSVPLAALAYDWYLRGTASHDVSAQKALFSDCFTEVIAPFDNALTVLIQRDYHAENLLWLPQRSGLARVGLLDFQDAMLGHPAYDLVSILQDARRDVPGDIEQYMMERFVAQSGARPRDFAIAYAVFGAQRNLRILGVFARLCMRDGKAHYVDLIPRVWRHLQHNLAHPVLKPVAALVSEHLPAPEAALLDRLKSQSGTCQQP